MRSVIVLKKHRKANEIWYTAQLPLQWLPEQSENDSVLESHLSSPVSHAPVALKHVLAPLMPTFAPKESVRPVARNAIALAAPTTMSATYRVLVTLGGVVHLQVHALQQAVHAAAPTHDPTHAPMAAMGAERRDPMRWVFANTPGGEKRISTRSGSRDQLRGSCAP